MQAPKHRNPIETLHLKTNLYPLKYVSQLLRVQMEGLSESGIVLKKLIDYYRY